MFSELLPYVYRVLTGVSIVVQILILAFLIRGPFRQFLVVAVYVLLDFAISLFETVADFLYQGWVHTTPAGASEGQKLYTHIYWTDEVILDLVLFLMVIVLTYKAVGESPIRPAIGKLLGGVVIVVVLLPFVLFHPSFTPWPNGLWFNSTTQLLNFGAAIMNLALWTALIGSKRRDPQFLTVSAGLGVVVTGAAVTLGFRHFIPLGGFRWLPDMLLLLTHLAGLLIWCWAFRPALKRQPAPTNAVPSH
jgi:hypothetical protein